MKRLLIICAASMAIAPLVASAEDPYISTAGNHGNEGEQHFIDTAWTITAKTRVDIGFNFDDGFEFHEGLAIVLVDGKFGFIDKTGKFVIEPKFDDFHSYLED